MAFLIGVGYIEGDDFVKKTISSAHDKKRLKNLISQVSAGKESKALESLSMMQPRVVSSLLRNEHPQTLALILSTQKSDHSSQILSFFPPDIRADIIYRISKIEEVSYDVLKQIEEALGRIKHELLTTGEKEIPSSSIGNWVMDELLALDHVAYIRFASVYLDFSDINAFSDAIERLDQKNIPKKKRK